MDNIKEIVYRFQGLILREGEDIDVYIPSQKMSDFFEEILCQGYVLQRNYNSTYEAFKFTHGGNFLNLDIICDFHYIGYYFGIGLDVDVKKYISDGVYKSEIDVLRYILLFRGGKKAIAFLSEYIQIFEEIYKKYIGTPIVFSKFPDRSNFHFFLSRKPIYLFHMIKSRYLLKYYFNRIKEYFFYLGKGKLIVLEGPDGSGKSTIAHHIVDVFGWKAKYIYFGNRGGYIETLFSKMKGKNSIVKLGLSGFIYICFLGKYFKILTYLAMGKVVVADRWPVYEYGLLSYQNHYVRPIYIFYKFFFPSPKVFIIFVEAQEVYKRKNELSIAQITQTYENLYQLTGKKGIVIDNNADISVAINKIIQYTFGKGKVIK